MKTLSVTMTETEYDQLGIETDTLDFSYLVGIIHNEKKPVCSRNNWLDHAFALMDKAHGHSDGQKWTREDLYRG